MTVSVIPTPDFFTPICYLDSPKSCASSALEFVDDFLDLGNTKAYVIEGRTKNGYEKVVLSESENSLLLKIGKIFLFCLVAVIPLFMLILKVVLRSIHNFKVIDPKKQLEKGINISVEIANKVESLIPQILTGETNEEVEYLKGSKIFKLKQYPGIVFKMGASSSTTSRTRALHNGKFLDEREIMEERFENMVKGKAINLIYRLNQLDHPAAQKLEFRTTDGWLCTVVAEECKDINPIESAQKELYLTFVDQLDEAVRQMAIFIAKTKFNDVTPRNIPILNEAEGFNGPRRITLIDLEHMESSQKGFLGDSNGSCGLLHCVYSEHQIDIITNIARNEGIIISDTCKQERLAEIDSENQLKIYYHNKGITSGKERLEVDIERLDLDLSEEAKILRWNADFTKKEVATVQLRTAVIDVIDEINRLIEIASDDNSVQGKRDLYINTHNDPFNAYSYAGACKDPLDFFNGFDESKIWLTRILNSLVDKGHIFKLKRINNNGYYIQA